MNRPFKTYNGGKNGSGVYQAIINQIPPHKIFISMFGGNCGVMANKKRADKQNLIIDLSQKVIDGWEKIPGITAIKADATGHLVHLKTTMASTGIFLFADPPYLKSVRASKANLYEHEMTDPATHKKLLLQLKQYQCKVLISHYPCELYDTVLKGWRTIDIKGRTRNGMRIERLYMNYPQPVALHDYQYIGNDYRAREEYKKMAKNMIAKFERMTELERNFFLQHLQNCGYGPQDITTVKKPVSANNTDKPVTGQGAKLFIQQ